LKSVETLGPNIPTPYAIKRKGEADEVASAIVWLLSDVTKFVSGTIQLVDGAWIC
jgi:NAD(P)-dependent dehydrogenase (short-subunit alcohol dehydrogenase family)